VRASGAGRGSLGGASRQAEQGRRTQCATVNSKASAEFIRRPRNSPNSGKSGSDTDDLQESWLQTQVEGEGTVRFWWKVSSEADCDYLEFWIGTTRQDRISGSVDWTEVSYTVSGTGTHTLKWRYVKDGSESAGDDCGYVDHIQWSGPLPQDPDPSVWRELTYVYDAQGRRSEKKYDRATVLKYIYDGDQCIAEYDAGGNLRRKYVYGPGVDEPVCMIESTTTYAGTYYYHFDASGNVVALTDDDGDTAQVYEYSVYGQVGATDPDHTNRFLFTGREFDKETGLYYYRARYYKPEIGRFLQVDPVGYKAGMNLYHYCRNRPLLLTDPLGLDPETPPVIGYLFTPGYGDLALYEGNIWGISDIYGYAVEDITVYWVGGLPVYIVNPEASADHPSWSSEGMIVPQGSLLTLDQSLDILGRVSPTPPASPCGTGTQIRNDYSKCRDNCDKDFEVCMLAAGAIGTEMTVIGGMLGPAGALVGLGFGLTETVLGYVLCRETRDTCRDYCSSMSSWCRGNPRMGVAPGSGPRPENPWLVGDPWPTR
jgi:RHS repeat-associated protein